MADYSLRTRLRDFPGPPTSVRDVATRFEWDSTISLRRLIGGAGLVPAHRTFWWQIDPSSVSGWCEVTIRADGWLKWRGHLHESGALSHHYYVFAVITVMLPPGTPLVVAHTGYIHGTLGFGSREDDWSVETPWPRARELWTAFSGSPANYATISVSTGPMQIVEALAAAGLVSSAASAAQVLLL